MNPELLAYYGNDITRAEKQLATFAWFFAGIDEKEVERVIAQMRFEGAIPENKRAEFARLIIEERAARQKKQMESETENYL